MLKNLLCFVCPLTQPLWNITSLHELISIVYNWRTKSIKNCLLGLCFFKIALETRLRNCTTQCIFFLFSELKSKLLNVLLLYLFLKSEKTLFSYLSYNFSYIFLVIFLYWKCNLILLTKSNKLKLLTLFLLYIISWLSLKTEVWIDTYFLLWKINFL